MWQFYSNSTCLKIVHFEFNLNRSQPNPMQKSNISY